MINTTTTFFATEQNRAAIRNFAAVVRTLPPLEATTPDITHPLQVFFSIFSENLEAFDQHCTVNIEWLGKRYIGQLIYFMENRGDKKNELLLDIFTTSYRLLCEFEFSQPGDISFELQGIKQFVTEVEVDPISRTPYCSYRRSPRCPIPKRLTRRNFESRWSSWFELAANPASWPKNSAATPPAS